MKTAVKPKDDEIFIYAKGLVHCSVCAPETVPQETVEAETNIFNPTGISSRWRVSQDVFRDEGENPCKCNEAPNRKHWLMVC